MINRSGGGSTMFGMGLVWFVTLLVTCNAAVSTLDDGLLVAKTEKVREVRKEYEVLIVIEKPKIPLPFVSMLQLARRGLNTMSSMKHISLEMKNKWRSRLDALLDLDSRERVMESSKTRTSITRTKRGLLDFVGKISKSLFGTATVEDVQRIAKAVEESRGQQSKVVHQLNNLLTIVNHSNHDIQINRDQLNAATKALAKTTRYIDVLVANQNNFSREIKEIKMAMMIESAVSDIERCAIRIKDQLQLYHRQKVQLAGEKFTEDLLTPRELEHILTRQMGGDVTSISPLNWYYEFCTPRPVWTGEDLVYQVILPLISIKSFDMFNLKTFPVLTNDSTVATQIQVHPRIAVDTLSGRELRPYSCMGRNPVVCRNNVIYKKTQKCEMALIQGRQKEYQSCTIKIISVKDYGSIEEVHHNEYVIQSPGEDILVRCKGNMTQTTSLPRGVHLLHVEEGCIYEGERWSVRPVDQVHSKARLTYSQIAVPAVNVHNIVEQHIEQFKDSMVEMKDLARVKTISLKPLDEADSTSKVDLSNFLNSNMDVWNVVNFVLLSIIYIIGFWYIIKKIRRKLSVKVITKSQALSSVKYEADHCESNLLSEDCEKTNEVKKLEIGTEVIRLYPTVPELA